MAVVKVPATVDSGDGSKQNENSSTGTNYLYSYNALPGPTVKSKDDLLM